MDFAVLVTCDEQSHKPGVRIASVRRYVTNIPGWRVHPEGGRRHRHEFTQIDDSGDNPRRSQRSNGSPTNRAGMFDRDAAEGFHRRSRMECPRCSLTVVMREQTLAEVFDKLEHAGVSTITLRALGAIVRNS
jgi:hypothetical protein